mgnify:CR=1 FL=1
MKNEFCYDVKALDDMERVKRLKLINSISGIKSANLIGTKSKKGISNLCIISSVTHIGSNPPLIGFICRPNNKVKRDTFDNILENPYFTINSVEKSKIKNAHLTSAKYDKEISEFDECGFKEYYIDNFPIPFVLESRVKIGMELKQKVKLINTFYKKNLGFSPKIAILGLNPHVIIQPNGFKINEGYIIEFISMGYAAYNGWFR